MLVVACYLWRDPQWKHANRFQYGPEHVRHLRDMVRKNLTLPHEFACFTNVPLGDDSIRVIPLDLTTHVEGTEFVKLQTFHPLGQKMIGERVLQLDLDTAIVRNIDPLVMRNDDLVVWRNPTRLPYDKPLKPSRPYYNGSVILHRCGTMPHLWQTFDRSHSRFIRDTQVWMSNAIGPDMPYWDQSDGIYRLAREDTPGSGITGPLPDNARIVNFVGSEAKPWDVRIRAQYPWIADYWPETMVAA